MTPILRLAIAALAFSAVAATAQHAGHGTAGQGTPGAADAAKPARTIAQTAALAGTSTAAFEAVNEKMHKDMAITFSGNADVDFVRGMIPHHQGAIDMAEVLLKHGKDAKIRTLATGIIKAQKTEIAEMQAWLAKNAK